jgi:hypothetical protein
VVTEEMRAQWRTRAQKLPPGPDVCFFFRPFFGRPTRAQFDDLITQLLQLQDRRGLDLTACQRSVPVLAAEQNVGVAALSDPSERDTWLRWLANPDVTSP